MVLVFDVTDEDSFLSVMQWVNSIKQAVGDDVVMLLVGNKVDLVEERKVTFDSAQALANNFGMTYIETSARTAHNVNKMVATISK